MSTHGGFLFIHMSHGNSCWESHQQPSLYVLLSKDGFRRNVTLTVGLDSARYHCVRALKLEVTQKSWRNIKASVLQINLCGF